MPSYSRKPGSGPIGRTFNRLLGEADNATETGDMSFNREMVQKYLDETLSFAEGEWFRGAKLSGAAEGLVEKLDTTGDGTVTWEEFQAFRTEILGAMAPGLGESPTAEQVGASATGTFGAVDSNADGAVAMQEAEANARDGLPADTEHQDLVAQLGARLLLDAVDTDQRDTAVADRSISQEEWVVAAQEMSGGIKNEQSSD